MAMPMIEQINPVEAIAQGQEHQGRRPCSPMPGANRSKAVMARVEAMAMVAIMEPQ